MAPCAGVLLPGGAGEELSQSLGENWGLHVWFCPGLLIPFSSLLDGVCWVTMAARATNEAKPGN